MFYQLHLYHTIKNNTTMTRQQKSNQVRKYGKYAMDNGKGEVSKMDKDTYALRRQVINVVRELKKVVPTLPRIEVRIQEAGTRHSGIAFLGTNIIFIPKHTFKWGTKVLYEVVAHEVVHAVTRFEHDENCPLMSAQHDPAKPLTKSVVNTHFAKYF